MVVTHMDWAAYRAVQHMEVTGVAPAIQGVDSTYTVTAEELCRGKDTSSGWLAGAVSWRIHIWDRRRDHSIWGPV